MNKKTKSLKETFALAAQNYNKKDFKSAELICKKILSIDSNHFDSTFLLANLAIVQRNFIEAKKLLTKALEINPKSASANNNLGNIHKVLGELNEAKNCYEKTIEMDPNNTNAHYNIGLVFYQLKEIKKAKSYFQKTIEIQPNFAAAFFNLGNVNVELKEFENAVSNYQKAIEIRPDFLGAHNNLGLVFRGLNDFENAINCYKKSIEIKPDHVGTHHNLALAFKELGDFEKAIESHETAIKYEPENSMHYYYLSELKKNILNTDLKNKIKKIITNSKSSKRNLAYGNYILAKYEQQNKNYEGEIDYITKGHQCFFDAGKEKFKLGVKYCFDDVLQIAEGAHVDKLDDKNTYEVKPIFIIGVPRSGSTLIEKVVASGNKPIPMGEETSVLENFVNKKILEKQSLNLGNVEDIRQELYSIYKQKGLISEKFNYTFTDKSLNNFFYIRLIRAIYPNAKIVDCRRDALSSIMSIFKNNLSELAWTHDLENIFKYFDNYFKIINNFNKMFPNFIYQLQFENFLNNPEDESKKLIKYCGLPWDKKCLEFYKRKDLISKTASNIQIRKAIYKHSSDRYLPYKKLLKKYSEKYSWFN